MDKQEDPLACHRHSALFFCFTPPSSLNSDIRGCARLLVEVEVFLPDISFQTGPKIIIVGFYQKIFKGCFLPDTSFQTRKVGSSQPDKTLSGRFHPKIFFLMDSSRHLSWLFNPIFSFGGSLQTTNIPHPMS